MENPDSWDEITKLIAKAIDEHDKAEMEGRIGYSLPFYLQQKLRAAGYLK